MSGMDTVVTVQARTQEAAEQLLAELCAKNDLRPMGGGRALPIAGRESRWMVRAQPAGELEQEAS